MKKKLLVAIMLSLTGATGFATDYNITTEDEFAQWTTIDANGDGSPYQWEFSSSNSCALYTQQKRSAYGANDWLISPAIELEAGKAYQVTFAFMNATTYSSDKQKIKIYAGSEATVAGMTNLLYTKEGITKDSSYQNYSCSFSPTESGTYYVALYLYSDGYQGNAQVNKMSIEELVTHPGVVTDLSVKAADLGELKAIISWTWPSLNDQGGALDKITGANIYRSTSSSFIANESTLIGTIEGDYAVGEANGSYEDASLTESGLYYYTVKPFNEDGMATSAASAQSAFIGKDTAVGKVSNVTATAVEGSDKSISITFDAAIGSNGGYVDPADIQYKIVRYKNGSEEKTIEEAWSGELPYIDTVEGLAIYRYYVYVVYQGTTQSSYSYSSDVITGGTYSIPYSEDFSNSNSNKFFTFFHDSSLGSSDWYRGSTSSNYCMTYYENKTTAVDVWFVSSGIDMQAGKAYKMSFKDKMYNASYTKSLAVYLAKSKDEADLLTNKLFEKTSSGTTFVSNSFIFSVPEDGVYYYGFQTVSPGSYNVYVDDITIEEVNITPVAVESLEAIAGENGAMSAHISWVNPSKDNVGVALESLSKAEIYRDDELIATLNDIVPGEASSYDDEAIEAVGVKTYKVIVYAGEMASPEASASTSWVGKDNAITSVSNVVIEAVEGNANAISVSFDLPTGKNNGYIDYADITYKIERYKNSSLDSTVDSWAGELPYVDDQVNGLAKYYYKVYAIYNETTSTGVQSSNTVITGGAMSVPYSETFDTSSSLDYFTLFYEAGDKNWAYNYYNLTYSPKSSGAADAWLVSPAIKFEKGKAYKLSYESKLSYASTSNYKDLYAYVAPGNDYASMTGEDSKLVANNQVVSSSSVTTEGVFSVPEDCEMYIGIRCYGESYNTAVVYLDNLKVVEIDNAPEAVSDLAVVVAEQGELKASLSWVNPSKDLIGSDLESIDKVEVYRGSDVIKTFEDVAAGSEGSLVDDQIEKSGIYTYKVIAYLGENASDAASVTSTWIGMDTPKAPASVSAVLNDDESRTISFDEVSEGVNGGYFDAEQLSYTILRNGEVIAEEVKASPYVDSEKIGLGSYIYGVKCVIAGSEGSVVNAAAIVCGSALELPYSADMSQSATFDYWTMVNESGGSGKWSYSSSDKNLSTSTSKTWAFTPPFYVKPGIIELDFSYACRNSRYPETLYVYLANSTNPEDIDSFTLLASEYTESTYSTEKKVQFDITADQLQELAGEGNSIDDVKFYIGFNIKTIGWICYLSQCDITQIETTGVRDLFRDADFVGYDKADAMFRVPEGAEAQIFDLSGVCLAKAQGSVAVDRLNSGVYIAIVKMADGSVNRVKFIKK